MHREIFYSIRHFLAYDIHTCIANLFQYGLHWYMTHGTMIFKMLFAFQATIVSLFLYFSSCINLLVFLLFLVFLFHAAPNMFQHIVVSCLGVLYHMDVYDVHGRLLSLDAIQQQFDWIISDAACQQGWLVDWMDGRLGGWLSGWKVVWVVGWVVGWLAGWLSGWMDGWLSGWMDGGLGGCLAGWMVVWVVVWLVDWLDGWWVGWLSGLLTGWMDGGLVGWLVGWMDGGLCGWLVGCLAC